MAAKSNIYEEALLRLIFNGTTFAGLAQNDAGPLTVLEVSLHTASPGASGNQTTNEAAYTGYTRIAVTRTSGDWTVTAGSCSPFVPITFPTATGGSETETYVGIGTDHTGSGRLLYFGAITPNIPVTVGVTPQLTTASVVTES